MVTADVYKSKFEEGKHLLLFRRRQNPAILIGISFNFVYVAVAAMDECVLQGGFLKSKFCLIGQARIPLCLEYFACNRTDAKDCFSPRKLWLLQKLLNNVESTAITIREANHVQN